MTGKGNGKIRERERMRKGKGRWGNERGEERGKRVYMEGILWKGREGREMERTQRIRISAAEKRGRRKREKGVGDRICVRGGNNETEGGGKKGKEGEYEGKG